VKQVSVKEMYHYGITKQVDSLLKEPDGIYIMEKEYQYRMTVKKVGITVLRVSVVDGEFMDSSYILPMGATGCVKKLQKVIVIKEGRFYNETPFVEILGEIAKSLI